MNPTKLRQLYKFHFPADEISDNDEDLLTAMYRLADIYDVRTLWSKTGWDLNEEITEVVYTISKQNELSLKNIFLNESASKQNPFVLNLN